MPQEDFDALFQDNDSQGLVLSPGRYQFDNPPAPAGDQPDAARTVTPELLYGQSWRYDNAEHEIVMSLSNPSTRVINALYREATAKVGRPRILRINVMQADIMGVHLLTKLKFRRSETGDKRGQISFVFVIPEKQEGAQAEVIVTVPKTPFEQHLAAARKDIAETKAAGIHVTDRQIECEKYFARVVAEERERANSPENQAIDKEMARLQSEIDKLQGK